MKNLKITLLSILALLAICAPFLGVYLYATNAPAQYGNTFVGALTDKTDRLYSLKEDKIVIVGGSSVAFGIDSALIEKYTGMPVVNYGLYAALGTKIMLDLSRDAIGKGDIVLIAPELDAQTLSLYFNAETALQAMDGSFGMMKHVSADNIPSMLGGMWRLASEKYKYIKSGTKPAPEGVYSRDSFNEFGDIIYTREENIMPLYYDPNVMIEPSEKIVSPDFMDHLNEYIKQAKRKGAEVYFGFCPMNRLGLTEEVTEESLLRFSEYLSEELACPVIGDIRDFVYEGGYFYDTNFHLNDSGVRLHSVNVTRMLLLELGIPTYVDEEIYPAPPLPESDMRFFGEDENSKYFTYEMRDGAGYYITGLSELGMAEESLTLPLGYDTYKVVGVKAGAFDGSSVSSLTVPEESNIRILETGAFDGAEKLTALYIRYPHAEDILPPSVFDFSSMGKGFKVYVPEGSNYSIDYYWSERGLAFEVIED